MKLKYRIKLKGTNCYLKNTGAKSVNFTTDINKAKVFETEYGKSDIIDKLNYGEYKPNKDSSRTDCIRLTMDNATWQNMFNEHLDQVKAISDSRRGTHQYSFSLLAQFGAKANAYKLSGEYPNLECNYYGEDFEREKI